MDHEQLNNFKEATLDPIELDEDLVKLGDELARNRFVHIFPSNDAEMALCGKVRRGGRCLKPGHPDKIDSLVGCPVCGLPACPYCVLLYQLK